MHNLAQRSCSDDDDDEEDADDLEGLDSEMALITTGVGAKVSMPVLNSHWSILALLLPLL